jgi:hypothetical protein
MATRGHRPGTLSRYTCRVCGVQELVSGGSHYFRCSGCREAGAGMDGPDQLACALRGKTAAAVAVAAAIKSGALRHPSECTCEDCGKPAKFFDHRDYNKPLLVAPVCHSCNLKRGPAISRHGSIQLIVARGEVPFTLRHRTGQLLRTMGLPTEALAGMPAKLDISHWRALLPLFQQPAQSSQVR